MKKFAFISDIHSNIDALYQLKQMEIYDDPSVTFVFLGDYIDGFHQHLFAGIHVIRFVQQLVEKGRAIALKGNHDHFLVSTVDPSPVYQHQAQQDFSLWMRNGGETTLASWSIDPDQPFADIVQHLQQEPFQSAIDFLKALPSFQQINKHIRIAHAGIEWYLPFEYQHEITTQWIREPYYNQTTAVDPSNEGFVYVTGHTPNQNIEGYSDIIRRKFNNQTTCYLIDAGSNGSPNPALGTKLNVLVLNEDGTYHNSFQLGCPHTPCY